MTTINPTGFCPNCQQNALLVRERIDTCLAIILAIFTAGIGLIVYLAIYYSKPENRCIHCNTIVQPSLTSQYAEPQSQVGYQEPSQGYQIPNRNQPEPTYNYQPAEPVVKVENPKRNFCALCGAKLDPAQGLKFCANCGSEL